MIPYTKALELKHAGYPQELEGGYFEDDSSGLGTEQVYIPTLSKLIEACSPSLGTLIAPWFTESKKWYAGAEFPIDGSKWKLESEGDSPEEAVANLYLELHKK